jgi:hypothetical protein
MGSAKISRKEGFQVCEYIPRGQFAGGQSIRSPRRVSVRLGIFVGGLRETRYRGLCCVARGTRRTKGQCCLVLPCWFEIEWEKQGEGSDCEICRVGIEMIGVDNLTVQRYHTKCR